MKHSKPKQAESQIQYYLSVQCKTTKISFIDGLCYDSYEAVLRDLKELMKVLQSDEYYYSILQRNIK